MCVYESVQMDVYVFVFGGQSPILGVIGLSQLQELSAVFFEMLFLNLT